jgi:hypothetical protein
VSFRSRLAQRVYDYLDVGKSPRPADGIFVLAGKQERKEYGIKMWRFGYAPQLMSVGGSGWHRQLNLEWDAGFQRPDTRHPLKQHFLVRFDRRELFCLRSSRVFGDTFGSPRPRRYVREIPVRSLVVSSPMHLRRVALVFRHAFRRAAFN